MKMNLVGIRDTRFTNKDTGEVISGQTIFVSYEDEHVIGLKTDKLFLSEKKRINARPGCVIDVQFNMYGKISAVAVC